MPEPRTRDDDLLDVCIRDCGLRLVFGKRLVRRILRAGCSLSKHQGDQQE
ncbi:MAG: hypothetical protein OXH09_07245 [Gammaproteobacteria bacterium]|nr:hypothetical protein [Gammaproteobacteria bacterium]